MRSRKNRLAALKSSGWRILLNARLQLGNPFETGEIIQQGNPFKIEGSRLEVLKPCRDLDSQLLARILYVQEELFFLESCISKTNPSQNHLIQKNSQLDSLIVWRSSYCSQTPVFQQDFLFLSVSLACGPCGQAKLAAARSFQSAVPVLIPQKR